MPDSLEERVSFLEGRVSDQSKVDDRFKSLDSKLDQISTRLESRMVWLFGMQVTILLAVVGALLPW